MSAIEMIKESLTRPNDGVVVTETVDKWNQPIMAAITVGKGYENGIEVEANLITSTYGRKRFENFIQRTVDEGKLLYWDKEKSQAMYRDLRLQLPQGLYSLDSDTIIRKSNAFVNTQTQNSLTTSLWDSFMRRQRHWRL